MSNFYIFRCIFLDYVDVVNDSYDDVMMMLLFVMMLMLVMMLMMVTVMMMNMNQGHRLEYQCNLRCRSLPSHNRDNDDDNHGGGDDSDN